MRGKGRVRFDWFVPALLGAILLARIWPEGGIGTGTFSVKTLSGIGISLIFLLYGFRLNLNTVIHSIANWRLHLLIHSATFLIFPIIALAAKYSIGNDSDIWQGIIFLSIMPSTVSSAAVLVSLANGNVPAALFNSSLSSIIGIILPPFYLSLIAGKSGMQIDALDVFIKLTVQILLPLVVGVLFNPFIGKTAIKYKGFTRYFDQTVILSIVYYSFANSFHIKQFEQMTIWDIIILIIVLIAIFITLNFTIYFIAGKLKLKKPETITALFCGSTKSLVHGSTMGRLIYAGNPSVGIIILPILVYHSIQLILSSIMVNKFNNPKHK
ncbi:MAG TPA: bile acid:sodium symporter family protein [Lentimicrobium sp.]|nr:bile acid:sodium symporter family protein [Lentimicrobium sp.]